MTDSRRFVRRLLELTNICANWISLSDLIRRRLLRNDPDCLRTTVRIRVRYSGVVLRSAALTSSSDADCAAKYVR
jgi:hypothetical protein